MSKISFEVSDIVVADLLGDTLPKVLNHAARLRVETAGLRVAGQLNRIRQGVIAVQLSRLGADSYTIAETLGLGEKLLRGVMRPNTNHVRHLIAIGTLALSGVDLSDPESADMVREFARAGRFSDKRFNAEKAYVLKHAKGWTADDSAALIKLLGESVATSTDRQDEALVKIAKPGKPATEESADSDSEGSEDDSEGSEDAPLSTEDVLRMIATIGEVTSKDATLDRAAIIAALGSLATSLFNTAPAVVEHAA